MTVSSSQNTELTAYSTVKQALQRAALLGAGEEPSGADVTMGVSFLVTNLQEWQSTDVLRLQRIRGSLTLVAGQAAYTTANGVPSALLTPEFPMSVRYSNGTIDNQLMQMSHSDYDNLTQKSYETVPTHVLVEHLTAGPKFTLYPVPNANVTTLGFWYQRAVFDAGSGHTMDLAPQYQKAAILQLAADFAHHYKRPVVEIERLTKHFLALYNRVIVGDGDDNDISWEVSW